MFIRRTLSKSKKYENKKYYTYRLVESYRVDGKVKQRVLINLGADFNIDKEEWSRLSIRIEDIVKRRESLFEIDSELEKLAQQYALQLLSSRSKSVNDIESEYKSIDINSIENSNPKSIGTEHLIYETLKELELVKKFEELNFTTMQKESVLGVLIAKACNPTSEKGSMEWLEETSGAGELYGCDYTDMSTNNIYRASDLLLKNRDLLEQHLYSRTKKLFDYNETITLYDLTNTYFEGDAKNIEKAQRGRSKEKRSDAKLITLAVVLDSSGFIKKSKIYKGNVGEAKTLKEMIKTLKVPQNSDKNSSLLEQNNTQSLVIMDAGIASEDNINYLKEGGYKYLVVSRKKHKEFDDDKAVDVKVDKENNAVVRVQKVINSQTGEIELYCHSKPREAKENSMQERVQTKFIESLKHLNSGLSKPKRMKNFEKILKKVGALIKSYASISQYYEVGVIKDADSENALEIKYEEKMGIDKKSAMNGVYCLRTNSENMDEKQLWRTYTTLTDLEAVFRSLKSELGLRPIFHQKESRVDGHLFITILAYTIIHTIRYKLKSKGINYSWDSIRKIVKSQVRITTSMKCEDGRVFYLRKSSVLNEKQKEIYDILGIRYRAGMNTKGYM